MIEGVDTNQPLTAFAAALAGKGKRFAGRYLRRLPSSRDPSCLSREEVAALHGAGLAVLPIFQHKSNKVGEFTLDNARKDAEATIARCAELDVPTWAAIYLAFDTDFVKSNVHIALAYGEVWARAVKGEGFGTGCYGDRQVLELLTETNREGWGDLFDHRFATNAVGWDRTPDWDVLQSSLPYTILPGLQVDDCKAVGFIEAGMWTP